MRLTSSIVIGLGLILQGCIYTTTWTKESGNTSIGTEIKESDLESIELGKTNISTVQNKFGTPQGFMDTINAMAYYSKKCGERDEPLKKYTYYSTKANTERASSTLVTFLTKPNGIVCKIIRQKRPR